MKTDFKQVFTQTGTATTNNSAKMVSASDLAALLPTLQATKEKFAAAKSSYGFVNLPGSWEKLSTELDVFAKLVEPYKAVVIIGIGGSDLGGKAIMQALKSTFHNQDLAAGKGNSVEKQVYFAGDTTDPTILLELKSQLNLKETVFVVISKSGNTVEQASNFVYFRELVKAQAGGENITKQFIFLTDEKSGALRALANEYGFPALSIPADVGGRFSVLTIVGMAAAKILGLDAAQFLKGAGDIEAELASASAETDMALQFAGINHLHSQAGRNILVTLPYLYKLHDFAMWFRQLWAESLGKKVNKQGQPAGTGTTPVVSVGPTFQHSQLQLYNEGPDDKLYSFIMAEQLPEDISLTGDYADLKDFAFLKDRSMSEILHGQLATTRFALSKHGRPSMTVSVPELNEYYLGQLFMFFEIATVYLGIMWDIDPFDQPGVELSKNAMYGVLGKAGYEDIAKEFNTFNQEEYKQKF